jgi:RNA polymerase sigma-70 factor (ECF subfamily)
MYRTGKKVNRMEDREIFRLFLARSEQAVAALERAYGRLARSLARNLLEDDRDAEEAVSDAWLAVWNSIPPQEPELLSAYVCRIVRNVCIGRLRKLTAQKRDGAYDVALDELAECLAAKETVEHLCEAKELSAAIDRFLDGVSYDDRYLFVRRYWYADSVSGIAGTLRVSPHRVTVRLSRIRKRLYDYLKKEGLLS